MKPLESNIPTGFSAPKDYFKSLDKSLLDVAKSHQNLNSKETGFGVPQDYFKNLDARILETCGVNKPKQTIFLWRGLTYMGAVAASVVLLISLFAPKQAVNFDSLETASIESYITQEFDETTEFAALLTDEDLTYDNFDIQFEDSNLQDYLLQNTTLEHLIED